jgi:uncharacterized protein (TIGR00255 family)
MTAFARQEFAGSWGTLTLEIRSVNHRYLELFIRLPDELRVLEGRLREIVQKHLQRGKVDCQVRYQPAALGAQDVQINRELVQQLARACEQITIIFPKHQPVNPLDVLRWPDVLQAPQVAVDVLHQTLLQLMDKALHEMVAMRKREGDKLKHLLLQRLELMSQVVSQVRSAMPEIKQLQREKLLSRLQEIKTEVSPDRLEQELVFTAQKIDVDEELDRLITHIAEVKHILQQTEPVGRRLDFLMQELNREANTLGSKSIDIRTSNAAMELKVLIEQMREQVQNIE